MYFFVSVYGTILFLGLHVSFTDPALTDICDFYTLSGTCKNKCHSLHSTHF